MREPDPFIVPPWLYKQLERDKETRQLFYEMYGIRFENEVTRHQDKMERERNERLRKEWFVHYTGRWKHDVPLD